jgi:hypothetical protein
MISGNPAGVGIIEGQQGLGLFCKRPFQFHGAAQNLGVDSIG